MTNGIDTTIYYYEKTAEAVNANFDCIYGLPTVRAGRGKATLHSIRAIYEGAGALQPKIPIEIKNTNWIDWAGVQAIPWNKQNTMNKNTAGYLKGRGKELIENSTFEFRLPETVGVDSDVVRIYVIVEIEYSSVTGYDTEFTAGSPVSKILRNTATDAALITTAGAPTIKTMGTYDNLLQGVSYILSEINPIYNDTPGAGADGLMFIIIEGFSNQRGLGRAIPVTVDSISSIQIEGSVVLTKQAYTISILSRGISTDFKGVQMELIASQN